MKKTKKWYDYLWIVSALYLILGFFNILFAWLGLICFFVPLAIAIISGNKAYCNRYCGRGQLFQLLGERLHLSRNRPVPRFLKQKWFRYGFLIFFLTMFLNMLFTTYLVAAGASSLREVVTLLWTIPSALALCCLVCRFGYPVGCAVRVRFLQCHADFYRTRAHYHGAVQAPFVVRVLSDGHDDPRHLSAASSR